MRILISEDNLVVALMLEHMIAEMGHSCVGNVTTQKETIALALETEPDLILMDVNLKKGTGIKAAEEIEKVYNPQIIFISGESEKRLIPNLNGRKHTFLAKPFTQEQLEEVLPSVDSEIVVSEADNNWHDDILSSLSALGLKPTGTE